MPTQNQIEVKNSTLTKINSQSDYRTGLDINFKIKLVRSSRRTLCLQIKEGVVVVRSPKTLEEDKIRDFMHKKRAWLFSKLEQWQNAKKNEQNIEASLKANQIQLFGEILDYQQVLEEKSKQKIYRAELQNYIHSRIGEFCKVVGVGFCNLVVGDMAGEIKESFKVVNNGKLSRIKNIVAVRQIKIRNDRSRWGSCNSQGVITFSLKLAKKSKKAVDYVIIHELCHLMEMNHSKQFWFEVDRSCEVLGLDWKTAKKMLVG